MLALARQLIAYDSSRPDGIREASGFIKGWLEAHGVEPIQEEFNGRPLIRADVGPADLPALVLHGHLDVVPAAAAQFEPRIEGDRLIGRGAFDMKAALAAILMVTAEAVETRPGIRIRLGIVGDEESEEDVERGTNRLVASGLVGDFAITGEPTNMHVGVAAKGVLALRLVVGGRAAHGSTPWLGDNAVLRAVELFRGLESLPFARESSELFDRPSINLGRILGGDALNMVPDRCAIDVDIRYLPEQDPEEILEQVRGLGPDSIERIFSHPPIAVDRRSAWVRGLVGAASAHHDGSSTSVGRDGASDAASFILAGIPAVEYGPLGADHHGPQEWVSIASMNAYLESLRTFLARMPAALAGGPGE